MTFDTAIASLKQGEFVMVYDSDGRESEVDMMVAAEFITPEHVARMRQHAGGLISCNFKRFGKKIRTQIHAQHTCKF